MVVYCCVLLSKTVLWMFLPWKCASVELADTASSKCPLGLSVVLAGWQRSHLFSLLLLNLTPPQLPQLCSNRQRHAVFGSQYFSQYGQWAKVMESLYIMRQQSFSFYFNFQVPLTVPTRKTKLMLCYCLYFCLHLYLGLINSGSFSRGQNTVPTCWCHEVFQSLEIVSR